MRVFFLLLCSVFLQAQSASYLFPDEKNAFEESLENAFKHAQNSITILSPKIDSPLLVKLTKHHSSKSPRIILITKDDTSTPRQLIAYNKVQWYLYTTRALEGSIIMIDDKTVCHFSSSFMDKKLSETAQIILCTDDVEAVTSTKSSLNKLLKHSKPYLDYP
jgi:hypothetical protein